MSERNNKPVQIVSSEEKREIPEGAKVCGNCPYWNNAPLQFGPNGGECRANPPNVYAVVANGIDAKMRPVMQTQMQTLYPATDSLAWCGKHPGRVSAS